MVGRAVPTMVWSRAARNIPSISPLKTMRIWRWVRAAIGAPPATAGVACAVAGRGPVGGCASPGGCGLDGVACGLEGHVGPPSGPASPGRPEPSRRSPLASALRSSSVHSAMASARTLRRASDTASRTAAPRSVRLSSAARPSAGSGDRAIEPGGHQIADLAADGRQVEVDRLGQVREAGRGLLGDPDQQPVAGPADRRRRRAARRAGSRGGGWSRATWVSERSRPAETRAAERRSAGGAAGGPVVGGVTGSGVVARGSGTRRRVLSPAPRHLGACKSNYITAAGRCHRSVGRSRGAAPGPRPAPPPPGPPARRRAAAADWARAPVVDAVVDDEHP